MGHSAERWKWTSLQYNHDMPIFGWALFWKTISEFYDIHFGETWRWCTTSLQWNSGVIIGIEIGPEREEKTSIMLDCCLPKLRTPGSNGFVYVELLGTCRLKLLPLRGEQLYYRLNRTPLFVRLSYLSAAVQMFVFTLWVTVSLTNVGGPKKTFRRLETAPFFQYVQHSAP